MIRTSALAWICIGTVILGSAHLATADTYPVILMGTVTLEDGSPPPFSVSIERVCSDGAGDTPGPLANKKGEWLWRLEIDAFAARSCVFRASHAGYTSTTIDASNVNLTSHSTTLKLPPLVLISAVSDPYSINISADSIPSRAKGPFQKAMKALDAHNLDEAQRQLTASVTAVPKFAQGWQMLGIVNEKRQKTADARDAYAHAIETDPKLLTPYVTLARLCLRTKDWECAAKAADELIKIDNKHAYPEIYLHQAVARYELKDLPGAEMSAQEAIRLDPKHKKPRAEYVLGRILEAKGDAGGAREHISKYLELEPGAPDAELVQGHMLAMGKPNTPEPEPELEPL